MSVWRAVIAAAFLVLVMTPAQAEKLRIGTWNIANLHHEDGVPLRPGAQARDAEDFRRLHDFAASLRLDIVALQEIGSPRALERIFPKSDYHLIMSSRYKPGDENRPALERDIYTAYAVRKSKFPQAPDVAALDALAVIHVGFDRDGKPSAGPVRDGMILTLLAGGHEIEMLNVHLKSGCNAEPLYPVADTDEYANLRKNRFDCRTALAQALILENWIEQQAQLGHSVIVLGDFNRRLNALDGVAGRQEDYWHAINDCKPSGLELRKGPLGTNTTCWPKDHKLHFDQHIEFIVFDTSLAANLDANKIVKEGFPLQGDAKYAGDAGERLSDHCPVVTELDLDQPISAVAKHANDNTYFIPSRADQYQEHAAEYRALARSTFTSAAAAVDAIAKSRQPGSSPWVVSLDADETVLDNSPFQRDSEEKVLGFSGKRWDDWVQKREAQPVPGALGFLSHVIDLGGKVAIVTNRLCMEADATRENLQKLGFPADPESVCILVKPASDKDKNSDAKLYSQCEVPPGSAIKPANEKDARWHAVRTGTAADCWKGESEAVKASWAKPHDIVLYVGDNAKDFPGMTQDGALASPEIFAERLGRQWFLIPNAAYGSWEEGSKPYLPPQPDGH
jgi:predicted secreted acid phosphatase